MSTSERMAPSMLPPGPRRGLICSRCQRSARSWTSASTSVDCSMARMIHCSRSGARMGRLTSLTRFPTSPGVSPRKVDARCVKRRMRRSSSSIRMGSSTASRRLRTSALTRCSSRFRSWSSSFRVVSSSLVAWTSSLAVSSSSLRLCSSSLPDTRSSLAEASASLPRPCSSRSAARCSLVAASSSWSASLAAGSSRAASPPRRAPPGPGAGAARSSKSTTKVRSLPSAAAIGSTTRSQVWPGAAPSIAMRSLRSGTDDVRASASGSRSGPARPGRAILRSWLCGSPWGGSR